MRQLLLLAFILTALFAQAQQYEPQILILSPTNTSYTKNFKQEVEKIDQELRKSISKDNDNYKESPEFLSYPENIRQMISSEIDFMQNLTFFKQTSLRAEQYLGYRFYEKFPNLLIKLKDVTSDGSLKDLKKLAEKEELQYVLNFPEVKLFKENDIGYATLKVQLYDNRTKSMLLEREYRGDWNNPGFEFSCETGTISCTINNALSQALNNVIQIIAENSPTLNRQKLLYQERFNVLVKEYYDEQANIDKLSEILDVDENITLTAAYQTLWSPDREKFITFFLQEGTHNPLSTNNKDKNIKILTNKDISDEDYLKDMPQTYAYVVTGVKHQGKWYYQKRNVTYFQADNVETGRKQYFNLLQENDFFKDNSNEHDSQFWEKGFFAKVEDLTKHPDWEKYKDDMWKSDEINNREFIGLYEIVADEMRSERRKQSEEFGERLNEKVFNPQYEMLQNQHSEEFNKINPHALIMPNNYRLALNPTLVTNSLGTKQIRYFLAFPNDNTLYEWTYLEPLEVKNNLYGSEVVEQITKLTPWNFSVDNLNDETFWNEYVLKKKDGDYLYLKKVDNR